jgi:hypothetical protein
MTRQNTRTEYVATAAGGGLSTGGAFAVLFVALKLCDVIDWPWLWVLAPIWVTACLVLALVVAFAIAYLVACYIDARERAQRCRQRQGGVQPHEHGPARRWPR